MRHTSRGAADDVRMRGFEQRHTVHAALAWLDAQLQPLHAALGRVLAAGVVSPVGVPSFSHKRSHKRRSGALE